MKHNWQQIKLNEILTFRDGTPDALKVSSGDIPIISKISFADGKIELRNDGISNTKLVKVLPNDLVISGINAEKGAISINSFNQEISATIHYSAYFNNVEKVNLDFLLYYLRSSAFQNDLKFQLANGIKTELKPKRFLNLTIPLPSLIFQKKILLKLDKVKVKIDEVKRLRAEQSKDINNLLFSKYTDVVESSEWLPMKEVAPIHRRQVEVNPEETYYEIGVRSFGRGLFENPSFKGSDLTWQKPFWMREGDLLFSNIKAWEGAVGLIPKKFDGWVGSHRYITCSPNLDLIDPEFIFYYFRTFEGVEKLSSASPGTADRNRTLNNKLLQQISVPVPSIELQREFVGLLEKTKTIKEYHKQTELELDELMPSLLDKAFKGELYSDNTIQNGISLPAKQQERKLPLTAVAKSDDLQLAMIVALIESKLGNTYGEVGIQKTVFNLEAFYPVLSRKYNFTNYHFGTYSVDLRETIQENPFLGKKSIQGNEVFTVSPTSKKAVLDAISDRANIDFVLAVNQVLDIYTSPFIGKHTDKIELLNTVTKLIIDLQSVEVDDVYDGMKNWTIKQEGFATKADKFSIDDTFKTVELLRSHGLLNKLISNTYY